MPQSAVLKKYIRGLDFAEPAVESGSKPNKKRDTDPPFVGPTEYWRPRGLVGYRQYRNRIRAHYQNIVDKLQELDLAKDSKRFDGLSEFIAYALVKDLNGLRLWTGVSRNRDFRSHIELNLEDDCSKIYHSVIDALFNLPRSREGLDKSGYISTAVNDPLAKRLERLEHYAREYAGIGVADFARALFPELHGGASISGPEASAIIAQPRQLPTAAPATWKDDKLPNETPPAFVQRVYGEWLGKGFDRAMIRTLDPSLSRGIDNWTRKNEWPADVDLPSRGEQSRRLIGDGEALAAHLGKFTGAEAARELGRLQMAARHGK